MDKKRILLVGPYPPPYGGISSHLLNIVPYLVQRGFELFFLTFDEKDAVETPSPGVTIHRVNTKTRARSIYKRQPFAQFYHFLFFLTRGFNPKEAAAEVVKYDAITEIIDKQKIDLVSTYMLQCAFFVPLLREKYGERLAICTTVLGELYEFQHHFIRRKSLSRTVLEKSNSVMSSSLFCSRGVQLVGYPSARVETIYYGVDLDRFDSTDPKLKADAERLRQELGMNPAWPMVVFVGRFNDEMGMDAVLDAVPKVLSHTPQVTFLLAGAKSDLSAKVQELKLRYPQNVFIRENAPGKEIPLYYTLCDFLIAPSKANHPCMGVSIKEAMAAGRPTIATIAGGIPEAVVDGETGYLVNVLPNLRANPAEFIARMQLLLGSKSLMQQLGQNARKKAEQLFDNRVTAERVIQVFERCLQACANSAN